MSLILVKNDQKVGILLSVSLGVCEFVSEFVNFAILELLAQLKNLIQNVIEFPDRNVLP